MKYLLAIIPFVILCCMPNDSGQTPLSILSGTYLFNGGPTGDTVQLRFSNDSTLFQKLNSNPEVRLNYKFRNPYLISWKEDSIQGNELRSATGKVDFQEKAFDLNFADVYISTIRDNLNTSWFNILGSGDSINFKGDSIMVISNHGSSDTTRTTIKNSLILDSKSNAILYEYKIFSDTLLLMSKKIWKFQKI